MVRTVKLLKNGADPTGAPDFTLPVSILAQVIESLRVDIAAQSIPLLNIKLASVGDVTLNVSITGTPTVNIQTSGGANIVIDKLTQSAYTERQSVLANNGVIADMYYYNLSVKRGKFFPRGARGFIRSIEIYCDNSDSASHTFTVKASPTPGMGPVAVFTLSVAAGSSPAWRSVAVNRFWNYDSLFVWVSCDSDSYGGLGYDTGSPYDYYGSGDEVSWSFAIVRLWIRVNLSGETVGDLPVSGTVNTVEVPSTSSRLSSGNVSFQPNFETTVLSLMGAGECSMVVCNVVAGTGSHLTSIRFYCDGSLAFDWTPYMMNTFGFTASTPGISLLKYAANGDCYFVVTDKFNFRRLFEVKAYNPSNNATVYAEVYVSRIS